MWEISYIFRLFQYSIRDGSLQQLTGEYHFDELLYQCRMRHVLLFLSYDDLAAQERIIRYMILNGLIEETVYGRLNNIPFQPMQTDRGNDGAIFYLDHFINLYTGEFII